MTGFKTLSFGVTILTVSTPLGVATLGSSTRLSPPLLLLWVLGLGFGDLKSLKNSSYWFGSRAIMLFPLFPCCTTAIWLPLPPALDVVWKMRLCSTAFEIATIQRIFGSTMVSRIRISFLKVLLLIG